MKYVISIFLAILSMGLSMFAYRAYVLRQKRNVILLVLAIITLLAATALHADTILVGEPATNGLVPVEIHTDEGTIQRGWFLTSEQEDRIATALAEGRKYKTWYEADWATWQTGLAERDKLRLEKSALLATEQANKITIKSLEEDRDRYKSVAGSAALPWQISTGVSVLLTLGAGIWGLTK